jgi:MFS family permease
MMRSGDFRGEMAAHAETQTIETDIPQRLDRLPWSRFHWLVVIGLGTVWILDGLEVTIVGSVASRLTEKGSGIAISTAGIGIAAAFYVGGACLGALFFGQLTDRFGRKKLFLVTLALYIAATIATAFAWTAWYFYLMRFLTGAGIGGEYSAINSAIDELIPARVRGRIDLIINGSYWIGAMAGAAAAIVLLNESLLPKDIGWRISFAIGAILGLSIMLVRRNVPESPRWLFIHGREEEAERIVGNIEEDTQDSTGEALDEPEGSIKVRQRERIPFRTIAKQAFQVYPKRSVLCLALFVGQAFIYNAVTFDLGTLFTKHFGVTSSFVPVFFIMFAAGNFLGPLLLGHLFDTVGRRAMISLSYLGATAILIATGILIQQGSLTQWSLIGLIMGTFFLASAGASAAYLTVSEIFPLEMRALAIAFFYAVGTAIGGITGPLLFGHMIAGSKTDVMIAFLIGAGVMALGGIAEIFLGVDAEQKQLEDVAEPISAQEAEGGGDDDGGEREHEPQRDRHEQREARRSRGRHGPRRYRPGPGSTFYSPGMLGTSYSTRRADERVLDREVDSIVRALEQEDRPVERRELERLLRSRVWGPGRLAQALNEAVAEGRVRRVGRSRYEAVSAQRQRQPERERAGV